MDPFPFTCCSVPLASPNVFQEVLRVTMFEEVCKGRLGAVLVDPSPDGLVPLVRTTTKYTEPPQVFKPIHHEIAKKIRYPFNNALIEVYDDDYKTMGFHSDQAQDLAEGSMIGVFSAYEDPEKGGLRELIIKNKETKETHTLQMTHHSVILFSLETNCRHLHKIHLTEPRGNRWLGITFRVSSTLLRFYEGLPYLRSPSVPLRYTEDEEERKAFYKKRSAENKSLDYTYPPFDFTISKSDLMTPI